jgi:hypothetical protein
MTSGELMDDGSTPHAQNVVSLIAVSALGNPAQAVEAWRRLTDAIPFEHLPNSVIRAMPQIYLNIRREAEVPELARLKGVYRSSWSNNAMRFAGTREFFEEMNRLEINYRIIKGGAVSALVGHWGLRRMGDIDVVVAPQHESLVQETLRHMRFTVPRDTAWARTGSSLVEGNWESKKGALLDMHSTHGKPRIFSDLFKEDGVSAPLTGTVVRIPSPELMFALGVWHGEKAGATTDHIQTLLDLGILLKHTKLSSARAALIRSNLLESARKDIETLGAMGLVSPHENVALRSGSPADRLQETFAQLKNIGDFGGRLIRLPRVMWRRRITRLQQMNLAAEGGMRARLYQLWVNLGQLGPLEVAIHKYLGGFGEFKQVGGPIPERDFRIRIDGPNGVPGVLLIHFSLGSRGKNLAQRKLFINGTAHGNVPLPEGVAGKYEVTPLRDFVEVSVRATNRELESEVTDWEIRWIDRYENPLQSAP